MSDVADVLALLREAAVVAGALDEALAAYELTTDRWRVLTLIAAHPGASMSDLIAELVLAPTSATRAVDALVDRGAVYRSAAVDDRRRVTLQVSVHGADLVRAVETVVSDVYRSASAELPNVR